MIIQVKKLVTPTKYCDASLHCRHCSKIFISSALFRSIGIAARIARFRIYKFRSMGHRKMNSYGSEITYTYKNIADCVLCIHFNFDLHFHLSILYILHSCSDYIDLHIYLLNKVSKLSGNECLMKICMDENCDSKN